MILANSRITHIGHRILLAFLIVSPVYFHAGINMGVQSMRVGQEQFFQLAATVLYAVFLVPNVFLAAFLVWTCFLFAYWFFPTNSSAYVLNTMFATMIYHVFYVCANERFADKCFTALKWLLFANLVVMGLQAANLDPIYYSPSFQASNKDLVGLFCIKAFNGAFISLMVPIVAYSCLPLAFALLFPIALCESSASLVAACVCLVVMAYMTDTVQKNKKAFALALAVLGVFCALYIKSDYRTGMFHDRFSVWRATIRESVKRPITGYGLDSFRKLTAVKQFMYAKEVGPGNTHLLRYEPRVDKFVVPPEASKTATYDVWDHPHNEFVSVFFEYGIVGLLIVLLFLRDIWLRYRVVRLEDEPYFRVFLLFFVALVVNSLAHFPFHVARVGYLIPVMLGLYYGLTDKQGEF